VKPSLFPLRRKTHTRKRDQEQPSIMRIPNQNNQQSNNDQPNHVTPTQFFVDSMRNVVIQPELANHIIEPNPPPTTQALPSNYRRSRAAPLPISATADRENSVQRTKGTNARPGSRRERRWQNRQDLLPTAEDLRLEGPHLLGSIAKSSSAFEHLFNDPELFERWEQLLCDYELGKTLIETSANTSSTKQHITTPLTSSERFKLIERSARGQLRVTNVPQGIMKSIEEKLLIFFLQWCEWPSETAAD